MAKLTTMPIPEIIIIDRAQFAILPDSDEFNFDPDAYFCGGIEEARRDALDWSVETARPVRIFACRESGWVPILSITA